MAPTQAGDALLEKGTEKSVVLAFTLSMVAFLRPEVTGSALPKPLFTASARHRMSGAVVGGGCLQARLLQSAEGEVHGPYGHPGGDDAERAGLEDA
ncbi:MAG: hypothetical protein ACXVXO_10470 [Mycobacteriaceae bacterium]